MSWLDSYLAELDTDGPGDPRVPAVRPDATATKRVLPPFQPTIGPAMPGNMPLPRGQAARGTVRLGDDASNLLDLINAPLTVGGPMGAALDAFPPTMLARAGRAAIPAAYGAGKATAEGHYFAGPAGAALAALPLLPMPSLASRTVAEHVAALRGAGMEDAAKNLETYMAKSQVPNVVFHGTTRDFDTFSNRLGNTDNHLGTGHYFSSSPEDVSQNYAGEGPDLRNRIEMLAEQMRPEHVPRYDTPEYEMLYEDLREKARKKLKVGAPNVMPAFLRMERPLDLDPYDGTQFVLEPKYDRSGEIVGEGGNAIKLYKAIQRVAPKYNLDPNEIWGHVYGELGDDLLDGVSAHRVDEALRKAEPIMYAEGKNGGLVGTQVIRDIYKSAGFDGVVMNADAAFGSGRKFGKAMDGIAPDTKHYVVFDPRQVKSATGNTGAFDPKNPSVILDSLRALPRAASGVLPQEFWHGTPSGDLRGSANGLHIGTREAAKQALGARIGIPAEGEWDGTREYGKTLLAGRKTLNRLDPRGYNLTGYNASPPEEDYLPSQLPTYGDGSSVSRESKPALLRVRLVGPMSNTPAAPLEDFRANGIMRGQIKRGTAKRGYFYKNVGEDAGSISAVVPNSSHIQVLPPEK